MATKSGNKGRYICKVGYLDVYNQQHAEGFIRLFSLPSRIRALLGLNKLFGIDNATTGSKSGASR